jgi:uncharacterized membrane protein YfcA
VILAAVGLGLLVGIVIGGLGGGGGVLTVPVLVYLLGQSAQDAVTSSIIIVGITALAGVLARVRGGLVDWRTALAFGAVGIPAALLGTLLNQQVAEPVLLLAFAGVTLAASVAMLLEGRGRRGADPDGETGKGRSPSRPAAPMGAATVVGAAPRARHRRLATAAKVVACGLAVGFLTGFLGVGGGFLVVPALVIVLRMPMTLAIGTSLTIIALNSAASFVSRLGVAEPDWSLLLPFTVAAVVGTVVGKRIADRLSGATLTRGFAVLLLVVGLFVAVESVLAL